MRPSVEELVEFKGDGLEVRLEINELPAWVAWLVLGIVAAATLSTLLLVWYFTRRSNRRKDGE